MMSFYLNKVASLVILLSILLLSGCSDSNSALFGNDSVQIAYSAKENIIPATWQFEIESEEALASVQWQFSDEGFANHSSGQSQSVSHTFNQAGIHRIRLNYETVTGATGITESEVIIQSGSISGKIFAALNTLVDVDTRDPAEPNADNNSFASAQALAANSRLSGVVDADDVDDYYQVQLQKDQSINLQVADQVFNSFESIQFQVFSSSDTLTPLFNANTQDGTGQLATPFVVPADDNYFIKLSAISPTSTNIGSSVLHSHGNYSLQIEAAIESADFVPGELVVVMKAADQQQVQGATLLSTSALTPAPTPTSNARLAQNFILPQGLSSRLDLGRIKALSLTSARQFMASKNMQFNATLANNSRWQTLQAAKLLSQQEGVLYAEPNWKRYASALPAVADPLYNSQWHYDSINLESAWQAMDGRGSAAVTVAVLDTGVLTAHPDLSSNLVAGYDFIDGDSDANDPGDKSIGGQRSSFHGTHVAGTVAAVEGNASGGTGVAPGVKIMPVRVLGQDGGTSIEILAGLCFAAQLNTGDNPLCSNVPSGNAADIINLSLGGPGFSQAEQAAYDAVMAKGIIVIAAAGNESSSAPSYPAAYNNVISVSATNRNSELASYSNFGDLIDIAAPGGDFASDQGVLSSWGDDLNGTAELTYGYLQGTSMAAPHVAGIAALLKSIKTDLTHNEFRSHLIAGNLSQDIGAAGKDTQFGHGLIDAHKAVLELLNNATPKILTSASSVFFDVSQVTRPFTLIGSGISNESELGTVTANISGADNGTGGSWLSLNKQSGLGEYIATVDRGTMAEGAYEGLITITSTMAGVDDVLIDVVLQIGNASLTGNAGVQYVLILDADVEANNDGVFASVAGSSALVANNGEYSYQVTGLAKGQYTISTGSDLDFDNIICDAGESCGQYPTLAQPSILVISEEQANFDINMTVNYLTNSIGAASAIEELEGEGLGKELLIPRAIEKPRQVVVSKNLNKVIN